MEFIKYLYLSFLCKVMFLLKHKKGGKRNKHT